jgi:hypothetical protein
MFQNAALDIAIALALMYLLLSLICTVVNEYIAGKLNLRSKSLAAGLQALLDDPKVRQAFYEHGLVAGTRSAVAKADSMGLTAPAPVSPDPPATTSSAAEKVTASPAAAGTHPSYVSTETFVLALVGSLVKSSEPGKPIPGFADVQSAIQSLTPSNLKDALVTSLTVAQGDFDKFRTDVARWFDDSMDRLSGAYKRHLKSISIVVGCLVAVALNADTFEVGRALWSDGTLRAQMVQVAESTLKATPSPGQKQPDQTGNAAAADTKSPSIGEITQKFTEANNQLRPLPIGWSFGTVEPGKETGPKPQSSPWFWPLKLLGLFVTGLALSLGAPFWFDTLSKFMNLRAAGVKPERKT